MESRLVLIELVRARMSCLLGVCLAGALECHKAMYLAQRAGIELGDLYEWHPVGILSRSVAEALDETWRMDVDEMVLAPEADAALVRLCDELIEMAQELEIEPRAMHELVGAAADCAFANAGGVDIDEESWVAENYPALEDVADRVSRWIGPDRTQTTEGSS